MSEPETTALRLVVWSGRQREVSSLAGQARGLPLSPPSEH